MESPSPFTYNGAKGMGEGGAAPVHTVCAALQDALYSKGVIINDSHNPPAIRSFERYSGQAPADLLPRFASSTASAR